MLAQCAASAASRPKMDARRVPALHELPRECAEWLHFFGERISELPEGEQTAANQALAALRKADASVAREALLPLAIVAVLDILCPQQAPSDEWIAILKRAHTKFRSEQTLNGGAFNKLVSALMSLGEVDLDPVARQQAERLSFYLPEFRVTNDRVWLYRGGTYHRFQVEASSLVPTCRFFSLSLSLSLSLSFFLFLSLSLLSFHNLFTCICAYGFTLFLSSLSLFLSFSLFSLSLFLSFSLSLFSLLSLSFFLSLCFVGLSVMYVCLSVCSLGLCRFSGSEDAVMANLVLESHSRNRTIGTGLACFTPKRSIV